MWAVWFSSGAIFGVSACLGIATVLKRRLVARLTARNGLVWTAVVLENGRQTYQSGRDEMVRPGSGDAAVILSAASVTRAGSLARQRAQRNLEAHRG
jgi:hypothetical protein